MWNKMAKALRAPLSVLILVFMLAPLVLSVSVQAADNRHQLKLRSSGPHTAYIHGYEDGTFRPDQVLTRAEAAHLLYGLLEEQPQDRVWLADVPEDIWYYDAVSLLTACWVIDCPDGQSVQPNAPLTRLDFIKMLSRLFPDVNGEVFFWDVPSWTSWYPDVVKAYNLGWITGYEDGSLHPNELLKRQDAVVILNRATGRHEDRDMIDALLPFPMFQDVDKSHWAYYAIMEACISHSAQTDAEGAEHWDGAEIRLTEGFHYAGADLYYVRPDGTLVREDWVGGLYFDADGRYTSGDWMVDNYIKYALSNLVAPSMTPMDKLRTAFCFTRDNFSYLRRPPYAMGAKGWEAEDCKTMFETGRGNCYCYAAVFYYFAKQLGFDARIYSGAVNSPHAWVEIDIDGVTCLFDPELEMAYNARGMHYNLFQVPLDRLPWPYYRAPEDT